MLAAFELSDLEPPHAHNTAIQMTRFIAQQIEPHSRGRVSAHRKYCATEHASRALSDMRFVLVCLLAACSKADRPPRELASPAARDVRAEQPRRSPTVKPSADIPEWVPIDNLD